MRDRPGDNTTNSGCNSHSHPHSTLGLVRQLQEFLDVFLHIRYLIFQRLNLAYQHTEFDWINLAHGLLTDQYSNITTPAAPAPPPTAAVAPSVPAPPPPPP